ncbi:methylenetetrahydrofolate reductase [Caldanaerobius polysaccharolyticus]|uniref:methylenetetrahydrofolate reductase n=1 Tax=Caldanaerobius polysaccharolyticus TaxID=44256 RepID=UPI001FE11FEF|nr:methylenetetrahydrofolate reductase [Caldanaerobius polysaccharolyticus]
MNKLQDKLHKGEFVITAEVESPKGPDFGDELEKIKKLRGYVDAVNICDNPMANLRMSPIALSHIIHEQLGIDTIFHLTCRDRNLLGLQSELLGAWALGITNILTLTGDDPKRGDNPSSTGVYDCDSIGLAKIACSLNNGFDISGNELNAKTGFLIGGVLNPLNPDIDLEIDKMKRKIDAGVAFFQTQPVYDVDAYRRFIDKVGNLGVKIIMGIMPLKSYKMAVHFNEKVPGVKIPENILSQLKADPTCGVKIAVEIATKARDFADGIHVMPLGRLSAVIEIARELGRGGR